MEASATQSGRTVSPRGESRFRLPRARLVAQHGGLVEEHLARVKGGDECVEVARALTGTAALLLQDAVQAPVASQLIM